MTWLKEGDFWGGDYKEIIIVTVEDRPGHAGVAINMNKYVERKN